MKKQSHLYSAWCKLVLKIATIYLQFITQKNSLQKEVRSKEQDTIYHYPKIYGHSVVW